MAENQLKKTNRRQFIQTTATAALALSVAPVLVQAGTSPAPEMLVKRTLGKTGFKVTTMGLGGQASIQWTPEGIDPVAIIMKAYHSGINYFDTSNYYGPSQLNYGKAFRQLGLVPGGPNYHEAKRKAIFLTSKTHLRFAKGGEYRKDVYGGTNGPEGSKTLDDVRRSLSQIFGDGNGNYPAGAYLDMVLLHNISKMGEVDAVYECYDDVSSSCATIGALAALRDVRDGTNLTGLNPKNEKLIRHIGFSGHHDPAVMIEMIQRDWQNLLDCMLVAVNANDKRYTNMQFNVIPVARAKNMGIIAMKVFADGAMYSKKAEWSHTPEHVVLETGSPELPASDLICYSLAIPGIHTAIIGIGKISDDPNECQLTRNLNAAQVMPESLNEHERQRIEALAGKAKNGETNYFQKPYQDLTPPREPLVISNDGECVITWHTALAGNAPIDHYEIWRDDKLIAKIPFTAQTTKTPYHFVDKFGANRPVQYVVKAVDMLKREAATEPVQV
jgi:aryl-alcohol dehydrogenase-like predicted oxidoreductase